MKERKISDPYAIYYKIIESLESLNLDTTDVFIEGNDPILPTSFLVGALGAAALACVGTLSREIWRLKTNKKQSVAISVKEAALAQRSHQYLKINNAHPILWDPISGFYKTKDDRWIQYHCNFHHHKMGVLKLLSANEDKSKVAEATKKFNAFELEATLLEMGMCANVARTTEEWHQHPQYYAIQNLPIIEINKLSSSNVKVIPNGNRPLSNVKVLDLTRVVAGPVCGKTLAEHGADVLLINSNKLPNNMPLVIDTSHGKRSALLDLDEPEENKKLVDLVSRADVFVQAYHPGALQNKGFGVNAVLKYNPNIIYVSIDAYTSHGPWALFHGYDSLLQSVTGIALEQGGGVEPKHLPCQTLDYITGYFAAIGAIEALRRQIISGGAYHIHVSLAKTANFLQSLGRVDYNSIKHSIPTDEQAAYLMAKADSKWGTLEYMNPVLKMSETQPFYSFLSQPIGSTSL